MNLFIKQKQLINIENKLMANKRERREMRRDKLEVWD